MDNRLQNLLGYDSNIGYMLALSKSGKYMMSRNGGDNWSSISLKHFNTVYILYPNTIAYNDVFAVLSGICYIDSGHRVGRNKMFHPRWICPCSLWLWICGWGLDSGFGVLVSRGPYFGSTSHGVIYVLARWDGTGKSLISMLGLIWGDCSIHAGCLLGSSLLFRLYAIWRYLLLQFNLDVLPKNVPWDTDNPPSLEQASPDNVNEFKGRSRKLSSRSGKRETESFDLIFRSC